VSNRGFMAEERESGAAGRGLVPDEVLNIEDPDFHEAILESLHDGVCLVDKEGYIIYWNRGAERITGFLRHEVIGRRCGPELWGHYSGPGEESSSNRCPLAEALAGGKPRRQDLALRHKRGYSLPARVRVAPIHNRDGGVVGAVAVFEETSPGSGLIERFKGLAPYGCIDELTGLASHALTELRLKHRLEEHQAFGIPFGVLLIDIDHLKHSNLTYGYRAGDEILRMSAESAARAVGSQAFVGRWGGEMFLVLVAKCDRQRLAEIAERIRALAEVSSITWWGDRIGITVSVGGCLVQAGDDAASLEARAMQLLESAQREGGNRVALQRHSLE